MALLNGAGSSKKGFQGAASNVRPKAQVGSGIINLNKLKGIQNRKRSGFESYKLNSAGLSRFRLVMPIGNDDTPMVSADKHWLPYTNDEGKVSKRPVLCYKQFGFSDCPICALQDRLLAARDQAIVADADDLKVVYRWAAYVINRDYLAGSDDPNQDYDPRQDKIQLFDPINQKVADDIIAYLGKRTWGNASDPVDGYDFEVEGEQSGKVYNGYKVIDYTVSPVPKDCSPAYSPDILRGVKPLSEAITWLKAPELRKIMDPILLSLSQDSEEAASIVAGFTDYYNQLMDEIVGGPTLALDEDVEEQEPAPEPEQIEVSGGDRRVSKARNNAAPAKAVQSASASNDDPEDEADGDGEGVEDNQQSGEGEGDLEEEEFEEEEAPFEEEGVPVAKPAPQVRPKPASPLPSARPVSSAANAGLLGKLKQVGKR